jgi:glycerol-3-phosphate dehydrogenase
VKQLGRGGKCKTKHLKLTDPAAEIDALVKADAALAAPLVPGLEYRKADAIYAVRNEMVVTLTDLLARRTRALLLDRDATVKAATAVATLVAGELGWNATEKAAQVRAFKQYAKQ